LCERERESEREREIKRERGTFKNGEPTPGTAYYAHYETNSTNCTGEWIHQVKKNSNTLEKIAL